MGEILDCVIVGQGLAGTWLAERLSHRGWKIRVFDDTSKKGASRVASGMMTPLTGKRLVPTWRLDSLLPAAKIAYQEQERALGLELIDDRPSLRVFSSADQAERWDKRAKNPDLAPYLGESFAPGHRLYGVQMPFGGCLLRQGARIDVQRWLNAQRDRMHNEGVYVEQCLDLDQITRHGDAWEIGGVRTQRIVFCIGHRAHAHAWTRHLPFKNARGDLIEVKAPPVSEHVHLQAGVSLTALGEGRALVGGNYDWRELDAGPHPGQAQTLQARMSDIVGSPLERRGHRSGVRPIVEGRVPVLGELDGYPGAYLFNGLASKGTMWAPAMAEHLRDVMDGRCRPDPELCVRARVERFGKA